MSFILSTESISYFFETVKWYGLSFQKGDKNCGNGVDYLTDNGVYCLRSFWVGFFHNRVESSKPSRKATLNCIPQVTNGMLVK